ncbi:MAG: TonB-dependent receptor [Tannerellaceae bacterium]|jgi:TonB-linked SusC/RagA family outer membrane protein|nr:TonB-dependent receptor [Tannerellaceae bacterium]
MMKKLTFLFLCLLARVGLASAQNSQVTGVVISAENGEPVIGANIMEKGTTNGTVTDIDGRFTLSIAPNALLQISYIGYVTQEVAVGSNTALNIILKEDSETLEDVVVIGYGVVRKKDLSGAVAQMSSKSIRDLQISHPTEAMAGKLAGVQVQQVGGQPGRGATIRVRGAGSITAGNSPLYVVDGFPLGDQNLNAVNPNDIESIEVLKDASSAAIYGSRGSNGVVLVTTKSGRSGKANVSLNISAGFQQLTKKLDILDAQEFAMLSKEAFNNHYLDNNPAGSASDPLGDRPAGQRYRYPAIYDDAAHMAALGKGVDWQDEIFRIAPVQDYQLSVTGGNDNTTYLFSAAYFDQQGIVINSDYQRFSARAKIDTKINKWLKMGVNLAPSYSLNHSVPEGHWASGGVVNSALAIAPVIPMYMEDGTTWASAALYAVSNDGLTGVPNPVANSNIKDYETTMRITGSGYIEITPLKNLTIKSTINTDIRNWREEYFYFSTIPGNGTIAPLPASARNAREESRENLNWESQNQISYNNTWGKHNLDAIAVFSAQQNIYRMTQLTGNTYPDDIIQTINIAQVKNGTSDRSVWTMVSYLARAMYNYDGKYYLTGSIRSDGSSRFGMNNRFGYFPSGSVMWRVSQENFLKDVSWLSDLKLRASYGVTGTNAVSNYAAIGTMGKADYVFGQGSGNVVSGIVQNSFSNSDLTWEKGRQTDIGLDVSFLKNRLNLTLDWYYRKTTDLLLSVNIPTITGFGSAMQNIGAMENKGVELSITGLPVAKSNFSWEISGNMSFNRNKVLALGPSGDPIFTDGGIGSSNITQIGQPIGSFYGYRMLGLFMTAAELDTYPHVADTRPGDVKWEDVNKDGKIDADDRTIIGNNMPDFTWGLTQSFTWKNFDASISLQGVVGNEIYHLARRFYMQGEGNQNQTRVMLNRWQSESNPGNGIIPRVNSQPTGQNNNQSTRWVEDGTFARINNLAIGYTLPADFSRKLNMQRARIYATAQNLLTITNYSGYNPETSYQQDDARSAGGDYGRIPLARTISFGLNITF